MTDPGTMKLEAVLNLSKRLLDNSKKRIEQLEDATDQELVKGENADGRKLASWGQQINAERNRLEIHRLYYTELVMLVTGQEPP